MRNSATTFLQPGDIRDLTQPSNLAGLGAVLAVWGVIAGTLWLAAAVPGPVTALLGVLVLGNRQLGLAIVMHEAAHKTLFRTPAVNEFAGQWLAGAPIVQDLHRYREHHRRHHAHTGTPRDPDLRLASGFPVTRGSLARKLLRDVSGLTGLKTLFGSVLMLGGLMKYDVSGASHPIEWRGRGLAEVLVTAARGLAPAVATQLLLAGALFAAGAGWLYGLWIVALLTAYPLFLRIRSIAEHSMTDDPEDALNCARTVTARGWERWLAPMNVSYHLEHHMLTGVPWYRLPRMHRLLADRGAFERPAAVTDSYASVLRQVSSAD